MSHGNLAAKVVASDFWPSCENCQLYKACQGRTPTSRVPALVALGKGKRGVRGRNADRSLVGRHRRHRSAAHRLYKLRGGGPSGQRACRSPAALPGIGAGAKKTGIRDGKSGAPKSWTQNHRRSHAVCSNAISKFSQSRASYAPW